MIGIGLTLSLSPPDHSLDLGGLNHHKGLIQSAFHQLVRSLLHSKLSSKSLARGRGFFGSGPEGIPITGHAGELLLQLLDPRRQRGDLLLDRDRLDVRTGTTKAEVLHLYAPRR